MVDRLDQLEEAVEERDGQIDDLRSVSAELLRLLDTDLDELVEHPVDDTDTDGDLVADDVDTGTGARDESIAADVVSEG